MNQFSKSFQKNIQYFEKQLAINKNFDLVDKVLEIGKKKAKLYFVEGMCKDESVQKLLEYFLEIKETDMPQEVNGFVEQHLPSVETELEDDFEKIEKNYFAGVTCLFVEGFEKCILIDARTYPARSVSEPEKDKTMRGSKDGFVETIVFNTALIRRRIRSNDLRMEMFCIGETSKTDVVVSYMDKRVNYELLDKVKGILQNIKTDALTMNQESLAECIAPKDKWNPFPKFKYTERPDTAAAQVLDGGIVILLDNSPFVMLLPTNAFTILEESDDFYFPAITGTYLRLARAVIIITSYFLTPTFLLLTVYPQWIPEELSFIQVKDNVNVPIILQFLILEVVIDGLRLAAVNTPNMLSTPFSVLAALVLGEFSVNSGWFNAEVMLYMVFVAIANYTQQSYEFAYALKFYRIITLLLTSFFGIYGYAGGICILLFTMIKTKTLEGKGYFYPLFPLNFKELCRKIVRK